MSYQVIARKWRPRNFEEVVHQSHISKTLQNSILNGRIYHAYLFSGPRGVGKTTMARILAKALNCREGPTDRPCDKCDNCVEIKKGTSFDVIEIDGASNNGVEDIRELRENVNFAPVKARFKVYIIDEVHMVTTQAFNALLKTLEEPPPHVKFIFATTEIHKIPETIISRCQKFFFKNIPVDSIVDHLKHIVEKEGFKIPENALFPIARASEGSMRDAQSLLDQVISYTYGGGPHASGISEKDALAILGIVPVDSYIKLMEYILDSNAVSLMDEVERVVSTGADVSRYVEGLIEIIRSLRLIKSGITLQPLLSLSNDEITMIEDIAEKFYDEELRILYKISFELHKDLRYTANGRVNLEMALLDMIAVRNMPSIASIIEKMGSSVSWDISSDRGCNKPEGSASVSSADPKDVKDKTSSSKVKTLHDHWSDFLTGLYESNQYLHFVLKKAAIRLSESILYLTFSGGDDEEYYNRVLDSEARSLIKDEMTSRLGYKIGISIIGKEEKGSSADMSRGSDKKDAESPHRSEVNEDSNLKGSPAAEKIKNIFLGEEVKKGD